MKKSLIEELPKIVANGRKEVEEILERLSGANKLGLQTNELVLPAKETAGLFKGKVPEVNEKEWMNRLIYGDNLFAMRALLAGDPENGMPSMRGKIDLIYIDPPFDSKTDYRTKVTLPLNAKYEETKSGRYTKNFLLVAPGPTCFSSASVSFLFFSFFFFVIASCKCGKPNSGEAE